MSQQDNTDLLELAQYHIDYWAGEGVGKALEDDVERKDLQSLYEHVMESSRIMFDLEYQPEQTDVY